MNLETLIAATRQQGASDLHLEAGLSPALRVRGALRTAGDPVPAATLRITSVAVGDAALYSVT